MFSFNPRPFGDTLRVRLHTLSRAWLQMSACRRCSSPEGNSHCELSPTGEMPAYPTSGSSRLALHDSGCVLEHVQPPDLG